MILPGHINAREFDKFAEVAGAPAVRTLIVGGSGSSTINFGFDTASVPATQVAINAITSTEVLAANASRAYAHLINNSGQRVWVQYGLSAEIGKGIPLNNGAMLTLSGFELWRGSVHAVSTTGSVNLDIMEAI
jgi:hypothetical protein